MGILSKLFKGKPAKSSGAGKTAKKAPSVKLKEVKGDIRIDGVDDFGDVCGFDLDQCPFSERMGERVPLLFGQNRSRALEGCEVLWRMASDFPAQKGLPDPRRFPVSMADAESVSASMTPPTPTGRAPRYPLVVSVSAISPVYEPEDWDAWTDAYVESGGNMPEIPKGGRQQAVAHISYLAGGAIGKASLTLWDDGMGISYSFAAGKGPLSIAKVEAATLGGGGWETVFKA